MPVRHIGLSASILIALSLLGWTISGLAQTKSIETEILDVMERLRSAMVSANLSSDADRAPTRMILDEILSDNYVRVTAEGRFLAKSEVLGAYGPRDVSLVRYEHMRVFDFEGGTAIAICLARFEAAHETPSWILVRVFSREGNTWRLIGEEARPTFRPRLSSDPAFPLIAKRNPTVPQNERGEAEVRAFVEQQRLAADPQARNLNESLTDRRKAVLAGLSTDYLKVWWTAAGWTNDNGPGLTIRGTGSRGTREDFAAATNTPDGRHISGDEPNAFLRLENLNVAVIGDKAIVTYRSMNQQSSSSQIPAYTVFRVYEKRAAGWLNIFSFG